MTIPEKNYTHWGTIVLETQRETAINYAVENLSLPTDRYFQNEILINILCSIRKFVDDPFVFLLSFQQANWWHFCGQDFGLCSACVLLLKHVVTLFPLTNVWKWESKCVQNIKKHVLILISPLEILTNVPIKENHTSCIN